MRMRLLIPLSPCGRGWPVGSGEGARRVCAAVFFAPAEAPSPAATMLGFDKPRRDVIE